MFPLILIRRWLKPFKGHFFLWRYCTKVKFHVHDDEGKPADIQRSPEDIRSNPEALQVLYCPAAFLTSAEKETGRDLQSTFISATVFASSTFFEAFMFANTGTVNCKTGLPMNCDAVQLSVCILKLIKGSLEVLTSDYYWKLPVGLAASILDSRDVLQHRCETREILAGRNCAKGCVFP